MNRGTYCIITVVLEFTIKHRRLTCVHVHIRTCVHMHAHAHVRDSSACDHVNILEFL